VRAPGGELKERSRPQKKKKEARGKNGGLLCKNRPNFKHKEDEKPVRTKRKKQGKRVFWVSVCRCLGRRKGDAKKNARQKDRAKGKKVVEAPKSSNLKVIKNDTSHVVGGVEGEGSLGGGGGGVEPRKNAPYRFPTNPRNGRPFHIGQDAKGPRMSAKKSPKKSRREKRGVPLGGATIGHPRNKQARKQGKKHLGVRRGQGTKKKNPKNSAQLEPSRFFH